MYPDRYAQMQIHIQYNDYCHTICYIYIDNVMAM